MDSILIYLHIYREFVLWIQLQKGKLQISIRNGRQDGKFYLSIYLSTIAQNWVGESQLLVSDSWDCYMPETFKNC